MWPNVIILQKMKMKMKEKNERREMKSIENNHHGKSILIRQPIGEEMKS